MTPFMNKKIAMNKRNDLVTIMSKIIFIMASMWTKETPVNASMNKTFSMVAIMNKRTSVVSFNFQFCTESSCCGSL